MDETTAKMENHLSSAAAFVEGGIQDACDDACSICLEAFCESDPSTVTGCKHEFHLQCILEWCQRSSQCPMCWQPINFKDPTSQDLLEAVERERNIRFLRPRNTAIFHHPTLGDFELPHLPVGANDAELEERIFQHLAAAAAMGRAHMARRDGRRGRSGTHGRPQYLVFSTDANGIPSGPTAASSTHGGSESEQPPATVFFNPSAPFASVGENTSSQPSHPISIRSSQVPVPMSGSDNDAINNQWLLNNRSSSSQMFQASQERAGPSDFQSFSESLKSRWSAVSTKYKESFTKTTRGWRERFFSRNTHVADSGSENRTETTPGVTTLSQLMEHLDTRETTRSEGASGSSILEGHSDRSNESYENDRRNLSTSASCTTASDSA